MPPAHAAAGPLPAVLRRLSCPRRWEVGPPSSSPPRIAQLSPAPLRCVLLPPFKRVLQSAVGRNFSPAPCISSHSDAAPAVPSLASASSHRTPFSRSATPHSKVGHTTAAVHPLGEPLAAPLSRRSRPPLTSLSLSLPCGVGLEPRHQRPPKRLHHPQPPPHRPLPATPLTPRLLDEPRLLFSCPTPSPPSSGACAMNLATSHPPASCRQLRHCVGRVRGDCVHDARQAGQREPVGPLRP
jgi:hypothetical protein